MFHIFKKKYSFASPFSGTIHPITEAPDETFASKMTGDGFFVTPTADTVYAPADSTVSYIADTQHALCLTTADGIDYFIHIGIDTVKLGGQGFTLAVTDGQSVQKGDVLLTFDAEYIRAHAPSDACLCIFTNLHDDASVSLTASGVVQALDDVCTLEGVTP